MDFLEQVAAARTCRRFRQSEPLPAGFLTWLVDCARLAPSAKNQQALRFAVVESPEGRAALFPALRWAGALPDWPGPVEGERPTGYVVILAAPENKGHLLSIDLGIAAQTMQLAAATRGVGCCMFQTYDAALIRSVIDAPEGLEVIMPLAFGLELEERRVAPVPESGFLTYWRDAAGVHYVPKRALDEVLVIRK